MKRYAIVRYKSEAARGSVFRDLARRERYVYVQPNGPENYDEMKTADVIWFDDKDDAVAAADWLADKVHGVYFCLMENQAISINTVITTKVNKSVFTDKGLLPA